MVGSIRIKGHFKVQFVPCDNKAAWYASWKLSSRPNANHRGLLWVVGWDMVSANARRGTRTSPRIVNIGSLYQTGWKSNFNVGLNR